MELADRELQFGFVNFEDPASARNLLASHKKDKSLRELVSLSNPEETFVFFAMTKKERNNFL